MSKISKDLYLYDLILNLTPTEKRYFKIKSSQHALGKENLYLTLFDIICEFNSIPIQEQESVVKPIFIKKTLKKRFDLHKANLYKKLLESLEVYHKDRDINSQIKSIINQANISHKKEMTEQVIALINSARKKCIRYEKWILLLEVLELERNFNYANQKLNFTNLEEKETINKLTNVCQFRSLQGSLWKLFVQTGLPITKEAINNYKEIGENVWFLNDNNVLTLESRYLKTYILQFYSGMLQKIDETLKYGNELIDLMENNLEFLEEKSVLFVRTLINLQNAYVRKQDIDKVLRTIKKINIAFDKYYIPSALKISITITMFVNEYIVRQSINNNIDQNVLMDSLNTFVDRNRENINYPILYSYLWQNTIYNFTHQRWSSCIDWLNKIDALRGVYRHDIQILSRILLLIVYFEMKYISLFKSTTSNTYRYLIKKENLNHLEKSVLDFLKKELNQTNKTKSDRKISFKILLEQLKEIKKSKQSHEALKMGVLYDWVEAQTFS